MRPSSTAILLAGGLANFTGVSLALRPKSFLPIANLPLYHYIGRVLGAAGVKRLIFCVPEGLGAELTDFLTVSPPPLDYCIRETGFGSGGSILAVADLLRNESFWVINGDLLVDADLTRMRAHHQERGAMATAACTQIQEAPWCMERVETDPVQSIRAIHRMHPVDCKRSKLRPVGLYLFEKAILDLIPSRRYFDLKEQLFPPLYELGAVTGVWEVQGYCRTISSIEDYFFANQDALLGRITSPVSSIGPQALPPLKVAPTAKFMAPAVMEPSSSVGDGAMILGLTTIGPHCQIGVGAIINDCVFLGRATVGCGVYLDGCVLSEDISVPEGVTLRETAIVKAPDGEYQTVPLTLRDATNHAWAATPSEVNWSAPSGAGYLLAKRALDIMLAVVGLIITSPVLLAISVAIKIDSPGNILFRQERYGLHARQFTMYKFRSMVTNSLDLKGELQAFNEVDGPMFKMASDPRVTRVGRWLRNTNLDELPQLWNVLIGTMSLVGPRPLSMQEMSLNPRWRDARLAVRPGMTGLWQVERTSQLTFSDWIHYDIQYVQTRSFWLDVKILGKTTWRLFPDVWQSLRHGVSRSAVH
jgi:lipopolysaccharide/colanic/teichoic acid biosynthesis glycosyltransferase